MGRPHKPREKNEKKRAVLVDGYVDEPACFGVPPYVSPYVRYCAGVLRAHGVDADYVTCDAWRRDRARRDDAIADADIVVVVMGLTVPGRYRGGSPLTMRELDAMASMRRRGVLVVGGPVRSGYVLRGGARAKKIFPDGVDFVAYGDPEASLEIFLRTGEWAGDAVRDYTLIDRVAPLGAEIVRQHPSYPHVIAEMELSRGCDRTDGRCSFCTEGAKKIYEERAAEGVAREVEALSAVGVRAFRLGRCANILAWGGARTERGVVPNAPRLRELYTAIRSAAPDLEVLHTDNCNPATIARFPEASRAALEEIAKFNTEGDGLSLGLESLDPVVREANCLKVDMQEALAAVRLINEVGNFRKNPNGLPALLPGLNFLYGLAGESRDTLAWNEKFLRALLDEGLAVRRINIRRAMLFEGTALGAGAPAGASSIREKDYRRWKEWVRSEVDPVMLARVAPDGTIIRNVVAEERSGSVIFGRPLGSYPPLVGIVAKDVRPGDRLDVMVTGRGGRSLTAVPWPLDPDRCTRAQLMALPEIGRARAEALISRRPYRTDGGIENIKKSLEALDAPGIFERLMKYFIRERG